MASSNPSNNSPAQPASGSAVDSDQPVQEKDHKVPISIRRQVKLEYQQELSNFEDSEEQAADEEARFEDAWEDAKVAIRVCKQTAQAAQFGAERSKLSVAEREKCERTLEMLKEEREWHLVELNDVLRRIGMVEECLRRDGLKEEVKAEVKKENIEG